MAQTTTARESTLIVLFAEVIDLSVRYTSLKRVSSDELYNVFSPLDINSSRVCKELEGNIRSPCQLFVHFVDRNTATLSIRSRRTEYREYMTLSRQREAMSRNIRGYPGSEYQFSLSFLDIRNPPDRCVASTLNPEEPNFVREIPGMSSSCTSAPIRLCRVVGAGGSLAHERLWVN
jgi:hypothetical protein